MYVSDDNLIRGIIAQNHYTVLRVGNLVHVCCMKFMKEHNGKSEHVQQRHAMVARTHIGLSGFSSNSYLKIFHSI